MAYQALLFCPDEKTARTVTQVLSELDFAVVPCTEPFAAVKRLMAEHFDAVVVDCDNEQNATLLFKSAHNSPNNQNSLAVAVVEGQAGVAKAFRIGANLVLTKPINVEQAKGTLRVARGLLRKGEASKPAVPAAAAPTAAKPAPAAPAKLAPKVTTSSVPTPRTATPMAPAPVPVLSSKPPLPAQRPVVASVPAAMFSEPAAEPAEDILEPVSPAAPVPGSKAESEPTKSISGLARAAAPMASSTGAASAPARAREPQKQTPEEVTFQAALSPEQQMEKVTGLESVSSTIEHAGPVPSFTFGGNASTESSGGGSKKKLLAIAAIVLVAGGAYAAWTHFHGTPSDSSQVAVKPAAPPTPVPAPVGVSQGASTSAPQSAAPESARQASPSTTPVASGPAAVEDEASAPESAPSPAPSPAKSSHPSASPTSKAAAPAKAAPAPTPIVIKNNSSSLSASQPISTADVAPPNPLAVATPGSGGSLSNLIASNGSAPQPVLQTISVSQGVSQGLLYKKVQPTYPPSALRMRVEGTVELLATISKEGDITEVKLLSGTPLLAHAAADAVKQWKYKPYLLNGEPVEIKTQITVKFKVPQ